MIAALFALLAEKEAEGAPGDWIIVLGILGFVGVLIWAVLHW